MYTPSGKELSNPALYGKNVRALMAQALDVPVTNHAFEDVRLLDTVSRKYGLQHIVPVMNVADARNTMQVRASAYRRAGMVGLACSPFVDVGAVACWVAQLDYAGVSNLLKRFREADTDNSGNLGFEECVHVASYVLHRAVLILVVRRFCTAMQLDTDAEYARRLFDCVDSDGDGSIDFREVVVGLSFTAENASTDAKLKMAFQVYDQVRRYHVAGWLCVGKGEDTSQLSSANSERRRVHHKRRIAPRAWAWVGNECCRALYDGVCGAGTGHCAEAGRQFGGAGGGEGARLGVY